MRIVKKILKFLAWFLGILLLLLLIFCVYVWKVSDVKPPAVQDRAVEALQRTQLDSTAYVLGNNWLRKSRYGLYEMYVSGGPFERGVINGKLSRELIVSQEIAFTHQIRKMIPSEGYLKFLKYVVGNKLVDGFLVTVTDIGIMQAFTVAQYSGHLSGIKRVLLLQ